MQRLEVSGAVRPIYGSLGFERLTLHGRGEGFFFEVQQPYSGPSRLIVEVSRSHSDTTKLVGFLWMGDRPVAETSIWQRTTFTRDTYACLRRDSNRHFSKRAAADLLRGHRGALHWQCSANLFLRMIFRKGTTDTTSKLNERKGRKREDDKARKG